MAIQEATLQDTDELQIPLYFYFVEESDMRVTSNASSYDRDTPRNIGIKIEVYVVEYTLQSFKAVGNIKTQDFNAPGQSHSNTNLESNFLSIRQHKNIRTKCQTLHLHIFCSRS